MIFNIKLMVVEDDPWIREFLTDALKCCVNRDIMAFDNPADAIEAIREGTPPHLIIADKHLPGMTGLEFLGFVKTHFPEIVFVLTSCESQDFEKAEKLGADAFMAVPYTEADIFKIIDRFVVDNP